MRLHRCLTAAAMVPLILVGVLAAHASPDAQGVTVGLIPAVQEVDPGAVFDLYMQVTEAGSGFNGFDAVVGYDPAALTLLTTAASDWQGTYMTGACGNTFAVFTPGTGQVSFTDVLLCSGVSLPGPGQLCHLQFQGSSTTQVTKVRFLAGTRFYDAGVYVDPVTSSDASIGIGMPVGVGPSATPQRLALRAAPNPSAGSLTFTVESNRAGPETLTVMDVQGRAVRRFAGNRTEPGVHTITWDGRNEAGMRLPPGVYLARLEVAGRAVWSRVTLIH